MVHNKTKFRSFHYRIRKDNDVNEQVVLVKDNAFEYHSEEQNKDVWSTGEDGVTCVKLLMRSRYCLIIIIVVFVNVISETYDMGDNPIVEFYKDDDGRYAWRDCCW